MYPVLLLLLSITATNEAKKPNIVLVVADDLGWADVPWHGSPAIAPTLSSLIKGGIQLERHYAQPICTPTRGALLTGKYPIRLGLQHLVIGAGEPWGLPIKEKILPEFLQDQGYATHAVGKWHMGSHCWDATPVRRGFDSFFGYLNGAIDYYNKTIPANYAPQRITVGPNGEPVGELISGYDFRYETPDGKDGVDEEVVDTKEYSMDLYKEQLQHIVQDHDEEKGPLFLYFPVQTPHFPIEVPKRYYDLYEGLVEDEDRRTVMGMISALDDAVFTLVNGLEQRGMWNNTVFIFLSDNGGELGSGQYNYPLRGGKASLWEGGIRTTAFLNSPLLPQTSGLVNHEMIHVTDWLPTIAHIATCGLEDPHRTCHLDLGNINGVDQLATILVQGTPSNRTEILVNIDPLWHNKAIIGGRWKLIVGNPSPNGHGGWLPPPGMMTNEVEAWVTKDDGGRFRLFDIQSDPYEREDVSVKRLNIAMELFNRLNEYEAIMVEPGNKPYDPASDPKHFNGTWKPWLDTC